jgi:putative nucleotidyltransferase with HDIG domain
MRRMHAVVRTLAQIDPAPAGEMSQRVAQLAERLERKDGSARDHTVAVSRIAVQVATHLGIEGDALRRIELGALLHDVGKLNVPDRILSKPTRLTDLEWQVMRRHAASGERLLLHILDLPDVLAIVRSHHERWDGKGYPDGLSAGAIPLGARIVAVADAFRAMIEPRPYRAPRSRRAAVAEILRQAGRQFDPACAEALRAVV